MILEKKTLGIVGMGRIGQALADRARAFGMKIVYSNRNRLPAYLKRRCLLWKLQRHATKGGCSFIKCSTTPNIQVMNSDTIALMKKAPF